MSHLQRLVGRVEEHVSIHPDVEPIPYWNLDRWLNIQVASGHLHAQFSELLAQGCSSRFLSCGRCQC